MTIGSVPDFTNLETNRLEVNHRQTFETDTITNQHDNDVIVRWVKNQIPKTTLNDYDVTRNNTSGSSSFGGASGSSLIEDRSRRLLSLMAGEPTPVRCVSVGFGPQSSEVRLNVFLGPINLTGQFRVFRTQIITGTPGFRVLQVIK